MMDWYDRGLVALFFVLVSVILYGSYRWGKHCAYTEIIPEFKTQVKEAYYSGYEDGQKAECDACPQSPDAIKEDGAPGRNPWYNGKF